MRGLVGSGPDEVSNVDFLFGLTKFLGARFFAFRNGMGSYAAELSARFDVKLETRVTSVKELDDHVEVDWVDDQGCAHTNSFAGCILAVPPAHTAEIHTGMDAWRKRFLNDVRYTKAIAVHAALSKAPAHIAATCVMLPATVHPGLLLLTFEHVKEPGRAPAGKGLVGIWTTSDWAEELMDDDDELVTKQLLAGGERILPGFSNDIEFVTVSRWNHVVLRAPVGHYRQLRRFVELCRTEDRLVQLAGDYFSATSMNTATVGGERAARDLIAAVRSRPPGGPTSPP